MPPDFLQSFRARDTRDLGDGLNVTSYERAR
jgi:hypothetical protein